MKRIIILGFFLMTLVSVAIWNVSISSNEKGLSDISLVNVEALAASEIWVERLCYMGPPDC